MNTVDNILSVGSELIIKKGYHNVGLQELLKAAQIPKGSFYYYFNSKEDFGLQLIKYYSENALGILNRYLQDQNKNAKERILTFFKDMRDVYQNKHYTEGCLLGNCSLELSDISASFSQAVANELDAWQKVFEECIREGQASGSIRAEKPAADIANFLLTGWEGALLRMKSAKNARSIDVFIDFIDSYIL